MKPFQRRMMNMTEKEKGAAEGPAETSAVETGEKKAAEGPAVLPSKEAYGFKVGKKTLKMTITATEINRVEGEEGLYEVRYKLRWEGVQGQGMEKDVTIRIYQDVPEGTEESMLQQEMMGLMLEAKRRYGEQAGSGFIFHSP